MILFLHVDRFYASIHSPSRPLIVVRNKSVLDLNDLALRSGVVLGMKLAEARSILTKNPMGLPTTVVEWKQDDYEPFQENWLEACVPFSDVIEPIDQHEAYVDLSRHPHPEDLLGSLVNSTSSHIPSGASLKFGVGRTKWTAQSAFRCSDWEQLAYFAPNAFLDELPTSMMSPVSLESLRRLEFLGYRTVGEVRRLPIEVLKDQFGTEGLVIHACSRGRGGDSVKPIYPEAMFADRLYFESPVDNLEQIEVALNELSRRLGARMQDRELQCSNLRLMIGFEDHEEVRERQFSKPIHSPLGLCFALKQMGCYDQSVSYLRVQLLELSQADRKQNSLYVMRSDSRGVLEQSVHQVQKAFGHESVRLAGDIPMSRRQRLLRAWKDVTGWA
jgi:nucleotidyltransferase/DNA polymerase involved in DNA repair